MMCYMLLFFYVIDVEIIVIGSLYLGWMDLEFLFLIVMLCWGF